MIETFYGADTLGSSGAMFVALLVGLAFGFSLERAGFGSSRRLAGIFYFTDMTVLKVMFTALVVALVGMLYLLGAGWIASDQIYFMPSVFGAQVVGGLLFGVGFVMGGWCPGTAAVGLSSGKIDAAVFLGGAVLGTVLFNEVYSLIQPLYEWGNSGVRVLSFDVGVSEAALGLLITLIAIGMFWGSEYIERIRVRGGRYFRSPFLKAFSLALIVFACGAFLVGEPSKSMTPIGGASTTDQAELALMTATEQGADHIEPEELADRLLNGDRSLLIIDIRTPAEFETFHIRGAVNVGMAELANYLAPYRDSSVIVLYSNGMTHPAQARDSLARLGYQNVYILTDGLKGLMERCLRPASLRSEPVPADLASRINTWREFFHGSTSPPTTATARTDRSGQTLPGLVTTSWLAESLGGSDLRLIDCRPQTQYNGGHVSGSVCLSPENLRGVVGRLSSMLLPVDLLARQMSLMGIRPEDMIVIVPDEAIRDATLIGMALDRLGHTNWGVLDGGLSKWIQEKRAIDTALPEPRESEYPAQLQADIFTVASDAVLQHVKARNAVIIDVRPEDYYAGKKSDGGRAGHIPGAVNRPYTEDYEQVNGITKLKPLESLARSYGAIIPSKDSRIIVHCRTGHQASQTFFVLKHLLRYQNVMWYDAGWSEWASRPDLPVDANLK